MLISLPLYAFSEMCKNVKSGIRYVNACQDDKIFALLRRSRNLGMWDYWRNYTDVLHEWTKHCESKNDIKEFCNDDIEQVFNKLI